ncbi:ImmA/IrrE family metallo-endopeptidase [Metabacillus herbersteinensis]|uniref:ImmA/IrrE family metallo-endopeptidase n=1 Tax=Metabacillus herbersteinensis TaxID=283816 RepID=A0ABV6GBN0_9BACI
MNYQTTLLEDWIKEFYKNIGIFHPHQLDFMEIAARIGLSVEFQEFSSRTYRGEIILDKRLSPEDQWDDFAHEICHILRHYGNQLNMPELFFKHQEGQADNFSLHFCIPTFMLLKYEVTNFSNVIDGIPFVAKTFKVTEQFAKKRLIQYRNQIQRSKSDQEFRIYMNAKHPKLNPENYSDETKSILDKLHRQLDKKNTKEGMLV